MSMCKYDDMMIWWYDDDDDDGCDEYVNDKYDAYDVE